MVGEISAGVLLGPSLPGLIYPNEVLGALAEMGAIFLLFMVGLEMRLRQLLQVGRTASLVALLGVVFPFVLGFLDMKHAGHQRLDSIFLAAMVATSVGITPRVLQDTNALETSAARVILAAAVLDDILGMMGPLARFDLRRHGRDHRWFSGRPNFSRLQRAVATSGEHSPHLRIFGALLFCVSRSSGQPENAFGPRSSLDARGRVSAGDC